MDIISFFIDELPLTINLFLMIIPLLLFVIIELIRKKAIEDFIYNDLNKIISSSMPKSIKISSMILTIFAIISGIQLLVFRYYEYGLKSINITTIIFSIIIILIILLMIYFLKKSSNILRITFIILCILMIIRTVFLLINFSEIKIYRLILTFLQLICLIISSILLINKESNQWFKKIIDIKK
jgi:hypothetical protein